MVKHEGVNSESAVNQSTAEFALTKLTEKKKKKKHDERCSILYQRDPSHTYSPGPKCLKSHSKIHVNMIDGLHKYQYTTALKQWFKTLVVVCDFEKIPVWYVCQNFCEVLCMYMNLPFFFLFSFFFECNVFII